MFTPIVIKLRQIALLVCLPLISCQCQQREALRLVESYRVLTVDGESFTYPYRYSGELFGPADFDPSSPDFDFNESFKDLKREKTIDTIMLMPLSIEDNQDQLTINQFYVYVDYIVRYRQDRRDSNGLIVNYDFQITQSYLAPLEGKTLIGFCPRDEDIDLVLEIFDGSIDSDLQISYVEENVAEYLDDTGKVNFRLRLSECDICSELFAGGYLSIW